MPKSTPKTNCAYIQPSTGIRCHRDAKYLHRLTLHGETSPRPVLLCATCDKNMGRKRLMELGWPHEDTIKWEKDPDRIPSGTLTPTSILSTAAAVRRARAVVNNTRY